MDLQLLMDQAGAHFGRKAFAEAEPLYREVLDQAPEHLGAQTNLGSVLLLQERLPEAEAAYRAALNLQPDYLPALVGLVNTLLMGRQGEAALEWIRRAEGVRDLPTELSAELHKLAGVAHHAKGEPDRAVTRFQAYAELRPDDAEPLDCLYGAQVACGREAEALATLERITERFPQRIDALSTLARSLRGKGAFRKMNGLFEKMSQAAPKDAAAHNLIVHLCLAERKYAHARLYFERVTANLTGLKVDDHPALALARGIQ